MRFTRVHIKDGRVINLSIGESGKTWKEPEGVVVVELPENQTEVSIGDLHNGRNFSKPEPVPPPPEKKTKEEIFEERILALELEVEKLKAKVK